MIRYETNIQVTGVDLKQSHSKEVIQHGVIVTTADLNTWDFTSEIHRRLNRYGGLNSTSYTNLAAETALTEIESFA